MADADQRTVGVEDTVKDLNRKLIRAQKTLDAQAKVFDQLNRKAEADKAEIRDLTARIKDLETRLEALQAELEELAGEEDDTEPPATQEG